MFPKSLVYIIVCVAISQSIELPPELQEYVDDLHKMCISKSGISEDDYLAYDPENNPHDTKLQCYMKCLMLEAKWMSPEGEIQYDFIIETAHPKIKDLLVEALNKCRKIENGANLCEKASNFNFCLYGADPVIVEDKKPKKHVKNWLKTSCNSGISKTQILSAKQDQKYRVVRSA